MPYRKATMQETLTPARWPAPDYGASAEVSHAWLPVNQTVGDLVIQDDSKLVWLSGVGPRDGAAYAARCIVQDILRDSLAANLTARDTYNAARKAILFEAPEVVKLPVLMAQLQKKWS